MAIITHDTSGTTGTRSFRRAVVNIYGVEGTVTSPPEWSKMKSKMDFSYAHEICPHTKRPHLQCYAYSRVKMRLRGWINVLKRPENSHPSIQEMIATFADNEAKCSKEGQLNKLGEEPSQGSRIDLLDVNALLDNGKRPRLATIPSRH
jgi:hypothetical protein